jgi:hypothetical protein
VVAEDSLVRPQQVLGDVVASAVAKLRRALDVGEQDRDGPFRKLGSL